jgi:hypothetical protein
MVRVICVKWGTKYGADYVHRLRAMVARHLSIPHTFECVTESTIVDLTCRPLQCEHPGWWQKIGLFRPGFVTSPALYIDLDMIIVDSLDWIGEYLGAELACIENWGSRRHEGPLYEDEVSSAFMVWSGSGATDRIFENFSARDIARLEPHGDQTYITEQMRGRFTLIPQSRICSYKRHCRERGAPPAGASVVAFHGTPRPHEVADDWVLANWR